ncbi:MAG: hypothetical protein VX331_04815, partial [Candidatus Thermoplasmatota archaeon]|nr:hypothetical protein [Candidatus Thermoplasmatota archaeon]
MWEDFVIHSARKTLSKIRLFFRKLISYSLISNNEESDSFGFLISIVLSLILILSVSVGALFYINKGVEQGVWGPSSQLIDWHYDHLSTSGFNEMGDWSGSGVHVCIIDTGIELNHPHLRDIQLAGWLDLIDNRSEPYDDEGHGT